MNYVRLASTAAAKAKAVLALHKTVLIRNTVYAVTVFSMIASLVVAPNTVLAARTVNSITVNGSSSVQVEPSSTVPVSVNVTTSGGDNDWKSTSWKVATSGSGGGYTCVDHGNHKDSGTYTENFNVTAPSGEGTYNLYVKVYEKDDCKDSSSTGTLNNAIVVEEEEDDNDPPPTNPTLIGVCHQTGNGSYVFISPNEQGVVNGHDGHDGDIVIYSNSQSQTCPNVPPQPTPVPLTINKVWQDANGQPVEAPDSKTDITITVGSTDCTYVANVLTCQSPLTVLPGNTVTITETGVPAGWMVDQNTIGAVTPVCTGDEDVTCAHTVINKLKNTQPCGAELVMNGGFESPTVPGIGNWAIYPSGTSGLGWSAQWMPAIPGGAPAKAQVELHDSVNGWTSHGGAQHAELDSDWDGPSGSNSGEDASVKMFQDLITVPGGVYTVRLWTSPRPGQGTSDNVTEVRMGNTVLDTIVEDGTSNSNTVWTEHVYTFTATSAVTRLAISDLGTGNSLGGFVDDVSVKQECVSDVTICKLDNLQNQLPGWEVYLKGPKIESVTVYPDGDDYSTVATLPAGQYLVEASGVYTYRPGDPNASVSDAAYSKRAPSDSVYGGPFAPWVRENDFPVPYVGWLGIQIDQSFTDWGSVFNPLHKYSTFRTLGSASDMDFRILDDNYSDNSGSLTVDIYKVIKGTTGKDGCVTLQDVDFGTYTLDEVMQDGWVNVSGQGQTAVVDGVSDNFTLVNECDSGCESQVTVCKIDDETGEPLSGWTVFLKGKLVETVAVNSNNPSGATTVNTLDNSKQYLVVSSGVWQNRSFETVDAKFTTPDGWTTVLDAPQGGYPVDLLELQVNDGFVEWGPYDSSHMYNYLMTGNGSTAKFRVYDFPSQGDADQSSGVWFGDNVGTLTVRIYEVYSGVTGENGCVTLQDVTYGTYELGEIMQEGWANEYGVGQEVVVNEPTEGPQDEKKVSGFTLSNICVIDEICNQPEPVIPNLHLLKVVCDQYGDVNGNEAGSAFDATNGNYVYFGNYDGDGGFIIDYLVDGYVSPSEINTGENGCTMAHDWQFLLSTDQSQEDNQQTVSTFNGEFVTPISGDNSLLSPELQSGIQTGNFWVSEVTQKGYSFAALRCYNDALNGDNLEYINLNGATPSDIYCIAYNIEQVEPCVAEPISVMSGTSSTFSWGVREGSVPPTPTNIGNYPLGAWGMAEAASPTGYPGAWNGSANEADVTGAIYVSNDDLQPTFGGPAGYSGAVDSYRLFSHSFVIPSGAINISIPTLHSAADNSVTAYIDDVEIGTTVGFSSTADMLLPFALTPGSHTLKFVVKNDAFDQENNPTGLIYKLDDITFDCDDGGGNGDGYKISGKVYEDSNANNTLDGDESGLPGWQVNIEKLGVEESFTDNTSSDENGDYEFTGLAAGCYWVTESTPGGWLVTEPDVNAPNAYKVAIGGITNCDEYVEASESNIITSLFVKTAHAASGPGPIVLAFAGNAIGLNFGNFDNSQGGGGGSSTTGGGGGGGGTPPATPTTPIGQVLGDSTNTPSDSGKSASSGSVLGATTLPRTGTPASVIFTILGLLAIVLLPKYSTVESTASSKR